MGSRPKRSIPPAMNFNKDSKLIALEQEVTVLRNRVQYLEQLLLQCNEPPADNLNRLTCAFCQEPHTIRTCEYFKYLQSGDRWTVAKRLGLCFRCLDNNDRHFGRDCPKTQVCRIRGCRLLHHRLLHDQDRRRSNIKKNILIDRNQVESRPSEFGTVTAGCDERLADDGSSQPDMDITPQPSGGDDSTAQSEQLYGYDEVEEPFGGSIDTLDSFRAADSLDSCDEDSHAADATIACDSKNDCQQMAELNRLAMLAGKELPFDLIFGGSTHNKSQLLRSEYVTPVTSCEELGETHLLTSLNSLDGTEIPHAGTAVTCDGNSETYKMDSVAIENYDLVLPSGGEFHENSIDSQADELDLGDEPQVIENNPTEFEAEDNVSSPIEIGPIDYSWINTQMENAVHKLAQKYRTNESTCALLDTLNNQINRLDEEIMFYDTIVSSGPPAEVADKTLEPLENMSSPNLSTWLMPLHL